MGKALYRKYRSKTLDEIVGQEHITTTLKNALKKGTVSHAYLFTGPRGVGKTSIARILAHELNGFDYSAEDMNLDIIEIDAASNRGIDEIRDLREKVAVAPSTGKYKVYIIDEVHMLTTPAFNALLKTLEEPPSHVVFILATTEVHKLPETIISRTQRHTFRPVEQAKVVAHLKYIAKQEKIKVDDEALAMIAEHGEGSFRDSISLLDQAASHGDAITADTIRDVLGIPPQTALQTLLEGLQASDRAGVVRQLSELQGRGYQPGIIAKQLAQALRRQLLDGTNILPAETTLDLLERLIDVPASAAPGRLLEICLLRAMPALQTASARTAQPTQLKTTPQQARQATEPPVAPAAVPTTVTPVKKAAPKRETPMPTEASVAAATPAEPTNDAMPTFSIETVWPQVLTTIKQQYNTVYGILRMGQPELQGNQLVIKFQYSFHQKRIQEVKHRKIISDAIEQLIGQKVAVECRHDAAMAAPKPMPPTEGEISTSLVAATAVTPVANPLATVSNIFGGGELLES